MFKKLQNIGGLILFYSVIIFGVLLLNIRFSYINNERLGSNDNYLTMNN